MLFGCTQHGSGTERRWAMAVSGSTGYRLSHTSSQPSYNGSFHISPGWRWAARHGAAPNSQPCMIHIIYSRVCPKNPCHGMSAGHLPHYWLLPGESTAGKRQSWLHLFLYTRTDDFWEMAVQKRFERTLMSPPWWCTAWDADLWLHAQCCLWSYGIYLSFLSSPLSSAYFRAESKGTPRPPGPWPLNWALSSAPPSQLRGTLHFRFEGGDLKNRKYIKWKTQLVRKAIL